MLLCGLVVKTKPWLMKLSQYVCVRVSSVTFYAGVFGDCFYGGDLHAAVHRTYIVQVQLQQVDVPNLFLRHRRRRLHRSMVSNAVNSTIYGILQIKTYKK